MIGVLQLDKVADRQQILLIYLRLYIITTSEILIYVSTDPDECIYKFFYYQLKYFKKNIVENL